MGANWLLEASVRVTRILPAMEYATARTEAAITEEDGQREYLATLAEVVIKDTPYAIDMLARAQAFIEVYGKIMREHGWIYSSGVATEWLAKLKGGPQDGRTDMAKAGSDGHAIAEDPVGDRPPSESSRRDGPGSVPDEHS